MLPAQLIRCLEWASFAVLEMLFFVIGPLCDDEVLVLLGVLDRLRCCRLEETELLSVVSAQSGGRRCPVLRHCHLRTGLLQEQVRVSMGQARCASTWRQTTAVF